MSKKIGWRPPRRKGTDRKGPPSVRLISAAQAPGTHNNSTASANGWARLLYMQAVLVLASVFIGVLVDPHVLLDDGTESEYLPFAATVWQVQAPAKDVDVNGMITLRNTLDEPGVRKPNLLSRVFEPPKSMKAGHQLRVAADISVSRTPSVPGATASVAVWFLTGDGERLGYRNIFFMPNRHYQASIQHVFEWPDQAAQGVLGLISRPGAPEFSMTHARVEVVVGNPLYWPCVLLIGLAWCVWACFLLRLVVDTLPARALAGPVLVLLLIGVGIAASNQWMQGWMLPAIEPLAMQLGRSSTALLEVLVKLGHAFLFMVLCLLLLLVRHRAGFTASNVVWFMLLLAAGSECLQLFMPDRTASVRDVLIDGAGIIASLVIVSALERRQCNGAS